VDLICTVVGNLKLRKSHYIFNANAVFFIGWVELKRSGEQALNRQIEREQRSQGAGQW
jgi:hypothetical protein